MRYSLLLVEQTRSEKLTVQLLRAQARPLIYDSYDIDFKILENSIHQFWSSLEDHIEHEIDSDTFEQHSEYIHEEITTMGADLCEKLFPDEELRSNVRSLAEESDVIVVVSRIPSVPWEALVFTSDAGVVRLGDLCVLSRVPNGHDNRRGFEPLPKRLLHSQAIIVDGLLHETHNVSNRELEKISDSGLALIRGDKRQQVCESAREVDILHWLCEHEAGKGLRISKDVFYKVSDAAVFRFKPGSILLLTTCRGGRDFGQGNFAATISYRSKCTVVSSQCSVMLTYGVLFLLRFSEAIQQSMASPRALWEVWRDLTAIPPNRDLASANSSIDGWRKVFQTLYCIHGPVDMMIGREA